MADIAEVLWNDFLRHNPANPSWFVGLDGVVIGMHSHGLSAPGEVVMAHFGFSAEHIIEVPTQVL